jgi:hypothetical protein
MQEGVLTKALQFLENKEKEEQSRSQEAQKKLAKQTEARNAENQLAKQTKTRNEKKRDDAIFAKEVWRLAHQATGGRGA